MHRGEAAHRINCAIGEKVRDTIIFHWVGILNKKTEFKAAMAVSRACDCGAKGPRFNPRTFPAL